MTGKYETLSAEENVQHLLLRLSSHINWDAEVNGSKRTNTPYSQIYKHWWAEAASLPDRESRSVQFVKELAVHALNNGGKVDISSEPGSIWQRLQVVIPQTPAATTDNASTTSFNEALSEKRSTIAAATGDGPLATWPVRPSAEVGTVGHRRQTQSADP